MANVSALGCTSIRTDLALKMNHKNQAAKAAASNSTTRHGVSNGVRWLAVACVG